jgi:hypothetical protein
MVCSFHNNMPPLQKEEAKGEAQQRNKSPRILEGRKDFANETPQLEFIAQKYLEAFVCLTSKCHPNIAGQGIEYTWGYSKLHFHGGINDAVVSHREENVKAALSCEVLIINQICRFAKKSSRLEAYLLLSCCIGGW